MFVSRRLRIRVRRPMPVPKIDVIPDVEGPIDLRTDLRELEALGFRVDELREALNVTE